MQSSSEFEAARLLREGRAAAAIEIDAASQTTRIPQELIRALEEGRYGDLPGPAYARAFARTLSNAYGLDPDMVVAALRRDLKEPADDPALKSPPPPARLHSTPSVLDEPAKERSKGPFVLLGTLALAFVALLGLTRLKDFTPTAPAAPASSTIDSAKDSLALPPDTAATDTVVPPRPHDVVITVRDSGRSAFLLYIKAGRVRKSTLAGLDSLVIDPDTSAFFRNLSTFSLRVEGALEMDSVSEKYFKIDKQGDSTRYSVGSEDDWKSQYDRIMERRKQRSRRDSN